MNLQLHHVISDITGVTSLAILEAILAGERNPHTLAALSSGIKTSTGHPYFANTFHSFGRLRKQQGNSAETEFFYKRALAIREATLPMDHLYRARLLKDYAQRTSQRRKTMAGIKDKH